MKFKKIKLELVDGKDNIDITQLLKKVEWSGSYQQSCRKLTFSLLSSPYDKSIPKVNIRCGHMIRLLEESKELFRGYIQSREMSFNGNSVEYMALDVGTYIHRNELVYNIKNMTAEQIGNKVCKDLGIPSGAFAVTGEKMDKKFFGVSAYDIVMTAYTHASTKTKKKYMATVIRDTFNVIEKGAIVLDLNFENGANLTESDFSEDISNMVNCVKVHNGDEQLVKEFKSEEDTKLYGIFSKVLKLEDGKDIEAEAKKELKKMERKASIEGFGDTTCICGYGVKVKDAYTGLVGLFYIDEDTHVWENGIYKVNLTLAFENMMDEVDGETKENETTSSGSSGGGSTVQGKEVDAEFTAYYASNDPMQGGFKDAMGNTLDYKQLTCASPKDVPFGTMVKVLNTGTDRDGVVYKTTDRGGAIKVVNGVYKFDLLMKDRKTAYDFGRRKGKAIIGELTSTGGGSTGGNASDKAKSAVKFAASKVGGPYVWGGNGPTGYDCSGLTCSAYKSVGISINRTAATQINNGKSVSKSDLRAGDLVFFDTKGGGKITHVGIMENNDTFIHASSPKNGIKRNKISESYYSKSGVYKGARRIV